MKKKILFSIVISLFFTNFGFSQENKAESTDENKAEIIFGADMVSRYIWRGLDLGSAPAAQPYLFWNKGGLSVGAWGSYALTNNSVGDFLEADLMLSYNYKFVTVMLVDFFFPAEGWGVNNKYFNYKNGETGHAVESSITFSGPENLPLNFMVGTVIYGDDLDANLDNIYSTYLELSYPMTYSNIDFNFFIGGVINDKANIYANGSGIINLGFKASKQIKISDEYSMGSFFSLLANPKEENLHLIFGINF